MKLRFPHIGQSFQLQTRSSSAKVKTPASAPEFTSGGISDQAELSGLEEGSSPKTSPGLLQKLRKATGKTAVYALVGVLGFQALAPSFVSNVQANPEPQSKMELLSHDHDLSPEQTRLASAEMDHLGSGAVRYLAEHGVKLHITNSDVETAHILIDKMDFRQVSPSQLERAENKIQWTAKQLQGQERVQQLSGRLDSLNSSRNFEMQKWLASRGQVQAPAAQEAHGLQSMIAGPSGGGGMTGGMGGMTGGFGMGAPQLPEPLSSLGNEIFDAQQMLKAELTGHLETLGLSEIVRPALSVSPVLSVESAVAMSGARTDQEKAEYRDLLYKWNGENLAQAQAEGLARQERGLELITHPTAKEFMKKNLEQARANPDKVSFETHKHNLLVPNFRYSRFEGQSEGDIFRVPGGQNMEKYVQGAAGLYSTPNRVAQVDHSALHSEHGEKVVVHELAHALDGVMEVESPSFHKDWHARLRKAYDVAKAGQEKGQAVNSAYGMTNHKEYIAEGVEGLFSNPEHLKETDPALYELSVELLAQANKEGEAPSRLPLQALALRRLSQGFSPQEQTSPDSRRREVPTRVL